jgi:hypothetical protein
MKGYGDEAIAANIRAERAAGKGHKQAVAIAMQAARSNPGPHLASREVIETPPQAPPSTSRGRAGAPPPNVAQSGIARATTVTPASGNLQQPCSPKR